jgi:hypothetical protein
MRETPQALSDGNAENPITLEKGRVAELTSAARKVIVKEIRPLYVGRPGSSILKY